jgi:chemotaxis protein CheC
MGDRTLGFDCAAGGNTMDVISGEGAIDLTRLRDLSERSMRRVEESLRSLLGHPLRLTICAVHTLPTSALSALAEDAECGSMVGLQSQITGQGNGRVLMLFPMPMIRRFLQVLVRSSTDVRPLTEMEQSAIQEVGNIMASSFLSGLGDLLGRRLLHSVPEIYLENIPQLVRDVHASIHAFGSKALVVHGLLEDAEERVQGRFFVVSEVATLEPIVHSPVGR